MGRGGAGSTLSSLASRQRQLAATRKQLTGDNVPQAPTRTQPQPVPPPAAPAEQRGGDQPQMAEEVTEFLRQRGAQARGQVPRTQEPAVQRISTRPGPTDTLADRVDQLGAANRPVETQFFRLAGREGTPREIALFNARLTLERQLNRPPTETELRMFIARPSSIERITSPVVERETLGTEEL